MGKNKLTILFCLCCLLPVSTAIKAQKQDVVKLADGTDVRGEIISESYTQVQVKIKVGAATKTFPASQVIYIEYYDTPVEFIDAKALFAEGSYQKAVEAFMSALKIQKVRGWLQEHCTLYIGWANLEEAKEQQDKKQKDELISKAVANLEQFITKYPQSRLLLRAFELLVESYIILKKADKIESLLNKVSQISKELQEAGQQFYNRLQERYAEFLIKEKEFVKASQIYYSLYKQAPSKTKFTLLKSYVESLKNANDISSLNKALKEIDTVEKDWPAARMLVLNTQAEIELTRAGRDKKLIRQVLQQFLEIVVTYYMRPDPDVDQEYHFALYKSAQCYQMLMQQAATEVSQKKFYANMALSSLSEIEMSPGSKYIMEAKKLKIEILSSIYGGR